MNITLTLPLLLTIVLVCTIVVRVMRLKCRLDNSFWGNFQYFLTKILTLISWVAFGYAYYLTLTA